MKLAISNIAWPAAVERQAAELLRAHDVDGVELAPTRRWPDLSRRETGSVGEVKEFWASHGLPIVALQALLFGRPELTIFGSPAARQATVDYLTHVFDLAAELGAGWLVFGSPRNRVAGDRPPAEVAAIGREFFLDLGIRAAERGVVVGIEANPSEYGADYLTRTSEAVDFVRSLNHPGIGCHLDLGGMILAHEPIAETIRAAAPIGYVHASAPHLRPTSAYAAEHAEAGKALRLLGYHRWVSIEMRPDDIAPLPAVSAAIVAAKDAFGR